MRGSESLGNLGAHPIDLFPFCAPSLTLDSFPNWTDGHLKVGHLPKWIWGKHFAQQLRLLKETATAMSVKPYKLVKQKMVFSFRVVILFEFWLPIRRKDWLYPPCFLLGSSRTRLTTVRSRTKLQFTVVQLWYTLVRYMIYTLPFNQYHAYSAGADTVGSSFTQPRCLSGSSLVRLFLRSMDSYWLWWCIRRYRKRHGSSSA